MNNQENSSRPIIAEDHKVKLFKVGTLFLMILSFFVAILAVNAIKQFSYIGDDIPPNRTVSVTGTGEVFAVPDTASISFSVIEEGQTVQAVQSAVSERMNTVLSALADLDIPESDIKTTQYSLNPRYEYRQASCATGQLCPPSGERQLVGYELRQGIQVKLTDREQASEVVQVLGDAGVQQIGDVQMTIDDPDELQAEARAKAIADAKAKAEVLERDLGVRFGRMVNFYESGNQPRMYASYAADGLGGGDMEQAARPSLPAGENQMISNVTIVYEIR